ncbi:IS110 family transposase [Alcaligenes nematophilus]
MRSVSGIGQQTAALLTELLNCIPFANVDALVAYSGLDSHPNDSGAKRGRRRISKCEPALLSRQLYLAAMSASRSAVLDLSCSRFGGYRIDCHSGS